MPGQSVLVILCGAGASYDCANPEFTACRSGYQPPLVKELFARRPEFDQMLGRNPKARALSGEICARIKDSSIGLEEVLTELAGRPSIALRKQYRQIPLYLQELLGEVSHQFIAGGSSNYETLTQHIEEASYDRVSYATVNYDTLLERAVAELYDSWPFKSFESYFVSDRKWSLFKLHGSVRWGREVLNCQASWAESPKDCLNFIDDDLQLGAPRLLAGHHDSDRLVEGRICYPWLSVPERGKAGFSCPEAHIEQLKRDLQRCTDMLIIGYSGLDEHVNQMLRDTPALERALIACETMERAKEASDRISFRSGRQELWQNGFNGFIATGESRRWLRAR